MVRQPSFDKYGMKKGAWSPEEDNKLRAFIQRYGHWNWRELPKYAGLSRCGKSCRLRWMNYLRPNLKQGKFTRIEEDLIVQLHDKLGNKWSAISAKLPGRTDNEIKNHWHARLKKRLNQNQLTFELKEQEAIQTSKSEANLEVQSCESTQSEVKHESGLALKDIDAVIVHSILESTPLSCELSSSEFFSSSSSDYSLSSYKNWLADDSISSWESFAEPIENFRNAPVLEEASYKQNEFSSNLVERGGLISPYSSYEDDEIDLIDQLLQEFPENLNTLPF